MSLYLGELSQVVEGSQGIELLQRQDQGLVRGRVHEVKVDEVIDTYIKETCLLIGQPQPPNWDLITSRSVVPSPKLFSSRTTFPRLVL